MNPRPPTTTLPDTLFPSTSLFRSPEQQRVHVVDVVELLAVPPGGLQEPVHRMSGAELAPAVATGDLLRAHCREVVVQRERLGCTADRSEEHTSELQSLMRISYAVFCLKKKKTHRLSYETIHI